MKRIVVVEYSGSLLAVLVAAIADHAM